MKSIRLCALAIGGSLALFAQLPDFTPPTPLLGAILRNDTAGVKRLLAQGADPNEARFAGFPPIFFPVMFQNSEMFRILVEKGADVRSRDRLGSTTLMWAAFNETGKTELVEQLLALGVDPNARNQNGETALTWALRRGYTPVVAALRKGGASDESMIKDSVERAISLLQRSGPQFVKVSGCTSCHHQSLPQMAASLARERGFRVDERLAQQQTKTVMAMFRPMREIMAQGTQKVPDPPITVSYALVGLGADGYAPDETTAAMAHLVSTVQLPDGSFRALPARPPMEASDFTATALSLRALQLYGKDPEERVAKALHWLNSAKPETNEDRAMRLLGMTWGKADSQHLRTAALDLLGEQRQDGGWGQTAILETDAYATGQALVALRWSGELAASDPAYQRGVAYLLRTQLSDGSWHVRTRAFPFQQYKESGFPHGVDQWISAAGSSWAAMALTLSAPAMGQEVSGF
jgi:hypothetical protein